MIYCFKRCFSLIIVLFKKAFRRHNNSFRHKKCFRYFLTLCAKKVKKRYRFMICKYATPHRYFPRLRLGYTQPVWLIRNFLIPIWIQLFTLIQIQSLNNGKFWVKQKNQIHTFIIYSTFKFWYMPANYYTLAQPISFLITRFEVK